MKKFKYNLVLFFSILFTLVACQEDNLTFGDVTAPTNLSISFEIVGADAANPNGDGSGFVNFVATADNAISYKFNFGDNSDEIVASGVGTHRYTIVGLNSYTVVVNAIGTGGLVTSSTINVDVFSSFDDLEAKEMLSGGAGNSKTWYWAAADVGHLGVGPANSNVGADGWWFPQWYAAQPFEKAGAPESSCIYTDELTFSLNDSEQLTYVLNNNGQTFYNGAHSGLGGDDVCLDLDTSGIKNVSLAPTSIDWSSVPDPDFTSRGTVMDFSDNGFMGYYLSTSSYEIISLTNNLMTVRVIDGLNADLAWYHTFSTSPPVQEEFESIYTNLVWADEFEVDGAPDSSNWTYDTGTGSSGWGNNEEQYYTDRLDNSYVEDGVLKIISKAESFNSSNYTSARLKTQGLYDFTYGRVDVRAKLPSGGGTWPAIWLLGSNIETVGWPACGEIDIMEHVGNNEGIIGAALHTPSSSGATINRADYDVPTATSEFHVYSVHWSPDEITFLVDDEVFYVYEPSEQNPQTWPYTADQFIILNTAMGGNLGGAIDSNFSESTFEIDYVRVFQ
ncbi:glycoside hydrolase family 16 protein [Urechidicola croceus]|uniref:Glucan endo-1,3-beta-D-glucosidase n=1 Tax=Urechidicola croceus TaxID=1850246 RepID=A0A1D8P7Z3_9FLAO|nr:glycoside hydrolase family 16 protein [Urechidicola croceus]AOW20695.1 glucan endo-1,3-beta-D-glucosidase [Urechidicola croceus]